MKPKKADFFKKGFKMVRKLFCNKCKKCTAHTIELIEDSPKDDRVHALRGCNTCLLAYDKLKELGAAKKEDYPVEYQLFFVQSYIFLVLHEGYID